MPGAPSSVLNTPSTLVRSLVALKVYRAAYHLVRNERGLTCENAMETAGSVQVQTERYETKPFLFQCFVTTCDRMAESLPFVAQAELWTLESPSPRPAEAWRKNMSSRGLLYFS